MAQFGVGAVDVHPHNVAERAYAICILFFGLIAFSSLISSVTNSFLSLQKSKAEMTQNFSFLRRYCKENDIPKELARRIERYAEIKYFKRQLHVEEHTVSLISMLSEPLYAELRYYVYKDVLVHHDLFSQLCKRARLTMHKVASTALTSFNLASKDTLFSCGEMASQTFCLEVGALGYNRRIDNPYEEVPCGKWFSEAVLWTEWHHLGDVVANTDCRIISMRPDRFALIMCENYQAWNLTRVYALKFLDELNCQSQSDMSDLPLQSTPATDKADHKNRLWLKPFPSSGLNLKPSTI